MKKFFKNKWFKRSIAILVAVALIAGGIVFFGGKKSKETSGDEIATGIVARRSIVNTVTGSGTVVAYDTYNIVPMVNGEIVICDVEEGQWVEEGQVLYKFDAETNDNAISKAQNSVENAALILEQAEESVRNLKVISPAKGVVEGISLAIGDDAGGMICTVTDNTYMEAIIPVNTAAAANISVGSRVSVGLEKYMQKIDGYVTRKASGSRAAANAAMVTAVEIRIDNPGSIEDKSMATATFHTAVGDIDGAEAAPLSYPKSAKVNAKSSGSVVKVNVKDGDWVNEGDVIAVLENTQLENQLKSAKMGYSDAVSNLNDTKKAAEDCVLKAPISGKILEKKFKKGDTVTGQNSTTLMVLADTSKMKFTMNIDELDVTKISLGQEVTLTADAIEGEVFKGVIETVSLLGASQQGVTTYPIQVRIDEPGELLPGMNVSAEILVEHAENVLSVPAGAVSFYDGEYYVSVVGEVIKDDSYEEASMGAGFNLEMPAGEGVSSEQSGGKMPGGGRMPGGRISPNSGAIPYGTEEGDMNKNMYPEPVLVKVTTGVSDDNYTEIVTGELTEGMIVQITNTQDEYGGFGFGRPMMYMG